MSAVPAVRRASAALCVAATLAALAACGGGGGGSAPPPLPDLSGVWAGAWQGSDPVLGPVFGTWEAELAQAADRSVTGSGLLLGDVDCLDGSLTGSVADDGLVRGGYDRSPCQVNQWLLTALDVGANLATGTWTQPASGAAGNLTGRRIAVPGGPRIRFAHPPSGRPGTRVTLVGSGFGDGSGLSVGIGAADAPSARAVDAQTVVATVPGGASSAPVRLTAPAGTAETPWNFDVAPVSPAPRLMAAAALPGVSAEAAAVAVSPDGRKAYVASRGAQPAIFVFDAIRRIFLVSSPLTDAGARASALVASPDGRRLYAALGTAGVLVADAALARPLERIAVAACTGPDTPQCLALSPDARRLYVTDDRAGRSVLTIVELATRAVTVVPFAADEVALAVAAHPDGAVVYVALADAAQAGRDTVRILDARSGAVLGSLPTAARPTGLALTPDGADLFVTHRQGSAIHRFDTAHGAFVAALPLGQASGPVAMSPDGNALLVGLPDARAVALWTTGGVEIGRVPLADAPAGVAIAPSGRAAFAVAPTPAAGGMQGALHLLGGGVTLTVAKAGTGIGQVISVPAGLDCGTTCTAYFDAGTEIVLQAVAQPGSRFDGWSGDAGCSDARVSPGESVSRCVATFTSLEVPSAASSAPGSGCFIATAAWGSPMAAEVQTLRRFRDEVLLPTRAGRAFVQAYYAWSPPVADAIREREGLRRLARWALWPVVAAVAHPAAAAGLALGAIGALLGRLILRPRRRQG